MGKAGVAVVDTNKTTGYFGGKVRPQEVRQTPRQSDPMYSDQVKNNAGGFVFAVDKWTRLQRFLILGSESNTFYVKAKQLTVENAQNALDCVKEDPIRVFRVLKDNFDNQRFHKYDPALIVLAMLCSFVTDKSDKAFVNQMVFNEFTNWVRTGYHLFLFVDFLDSMRSWGRFPRTLVSSWYKSKEASKLLYQVNKYQQRNGWSHRDVLRVAHPSIKFLPEMSEDERMRLSDTRSVLGLIINPDHQPHFYNPEVHRTHSVYRRLSRLGKNQDDPRGYVMDEETYELKTLIADNKWVTWEHIPSNFLGDASVWAALLPNLPYTALIRRLGALTANTVLLPMTEESDKVAAKIRDPENVRKARLHPVNALSAYKTYGSGHGARGDLTWDVNNQIHNALHDALVLSFKQLPKINKRVYIALDTSGSMSSPLMNLPNVSAMEAGAVLCGVFARQCDRSVIKSFSSSHYTSRWGYTSNDDYSTEHGLKSAAEAMGNLSISPNSTFGEAMKQCQNFPWGGTDCALPMLDAIYRGYEVDCFVIVTDSETWAGSMHPCEALRRYRQKSGIDAKMVVVAMTSTGFSIADPDDSGTLDIVGFDASVPTILNNFILE